MSNTCIDCKYWIHDRDENSQIGMCIISGEEAATNHKHYAANACDFFINTKPQLPPDDKEVKTFGFPFLSWGYELSLAMNHYGETVNDSIGDTLQENEVDLQEEALPLQRFCVWTDARVYFPAVNGGGVFVDSVSREPV